MYNLNEDYSLGQLLPIVLGFLVAYCVAKFIAFFGLVTQKNKNKWAIFFASIIGITYGFLMQSETKTTNAWLYLLTPLVFAFPVGGICWIFFFFAFDSVAKDKDKD